MSLSNGFQVKTSLFEVFWLAQFLNFDIERVFFYSLSGLDSLRTAALWLPCNSSQTFKKPVQLLFNQVYFLEEFAKAKLPGDAAFIILIFIWAIFALTNYCWKSYVLSLFLVRNPQSSTESHQWEGIKWAVDEKKTHQYFQWFFFPCF